eukprot:g17565.t1
MDNRRVLVTSALKSTSFRPSHDKKTKENVRKQPQEARTTFSKFFLPPQTGRMWSAQWSNLPFLVTTFFTACFIFFKGPPTRWLEGRKGRLFAERASKVTSQPFKLLPASRGDRTGAPSPRKGAPSCVVNFADEPLWREGGDSSQQHLFGQGSGACGQQEHLCCTANHLEWTCDDVGISY